jgi:tetratricopeptide (TPR) repeat protein
MAASLRQPARVCDAQPGYSHEAVSCYDRPVTGEAPEDPPNRARRIGALLALIGAFLVGRHLMRLDPALKPDSLHGAVGLLRYELRDYAGAAASYRADVRGRCGSLGLRLDADQLDLVCGTVEDAEAAAVRRLADAPGSPEPLLTLGEIALDEGRPEEAVRWFEQAVSRAPNDVDAHLLAALGQARTGRFSNAIQSMRRVLRDGTARRVLSLTRVLDETGRLHALPAESRSACLLAHLHRYLRIFDPSQAGRAVAQAEEAIERDDHAAAAYVTLGVIHQKHAEDAEALGAFLRAIELDPQDAEAYRWAAVVYADRGDLANQHRMTRAAYESAPDDPAHVVLYARLLESRLGDYRSALELERRHRPPGTETPAALGHRARLHFLTAHFDRARWCADRFVAWSPDGQFLRSFDLTAALDGQEAR